jgi:hypothetical protein
MPKVIVLHGIIVNQVKQVEHVFMVHVAKNTYLAQNTLSINYIFDFVKLLYCTLF